MATSGTTSYSATVRDVVEVALQDLGVLGSADSVTPEDSAVCRRKLNFILKQWIAQADFAPGLKLWTRRRGYLFLQDGQTVYDLGPTGDHTADEEYVQTALTVAAAASATSLTVSDTTGISAGDALGVVLDDGTVFWSTQSGTPTSTGLTLASGITSAASLGAVVFSYASKMRTPFEIVSGVRRDVDGNDTPIDVNMSGDEYEFIPSKSGLGTPSRMYVENKRTLTRVYLDSSPQDVTQVFRFMYLSAIEDVSSLTEDVDLPAEWLKPLAAQLAIDVAPTFYKPVTADMKMLRDESLAIAKNAHPVNSIAFFETEPDVY